MRTADGKAPAAQRSLERGADDLSKRRELEAELYQSGMSQAAIARELAVSQTTVLRDLAILGVSRRRPGGRRRRRDASDTKTCERCGRYFTRSGLTHPITNEEWRKRRFCSWECRKHPREVKTCAREGCDVQFTPLPWKLVRGEGRYCSRECSRSVYSAGSQVENERRRNGKHMECPVCGRSRYRSASLLHGKRYRLSNGEYKMAPGRYCSSECFHLASRKGPAPQPRDCLACSRTFTPRFPAFAGAKFCSRECWGRYRWRHGTISVELLSGSRRGRGRQRWLGRWNATKAPGPGASARGRPRVQVTAEQRAEIETLAAVGWGRRAIAGRLLVSERAVRHVLESQPNL
jgi:hypothetical protein